MFSLLALGLCACTAAEPLPPVRGYLSIGTGTVSGFVRDARTGKPLTGVAVSLGSQTAISSAAGQYEFAGLVPGQKPLSAAYAGYQTLTEIVTVAEGSQVRYLALHPHPEPSGPPAPTPVPAPSGFPSPVPLPREGMKAVWVSTLAGGAPGQQDAQGSAARFDNPYGIAIAPGGDLFVTDAGNRRIRRVSPDGQATSLAGTYQFSALAGIASDSSGNLYIADGTRVLKSGAVGEAVVMAGDSLAGFADGPGSQARFGNLSGIAVDGSGNVYVSDAGNQRIRKINPGGAVVTLAGAGACCGAPVGFGGFIDGRPDEARFDNPLGLALDKDGHLYVADAGNHAIRKISPAGMVSTYAGSGYPVQGGGLVDGHWTLARFGHPSALAFDSRGGLYVADQNCIRRIGPDRLVATVAGSLFQAGSGDGNGIEARFGEITGLVVDHEDNLYLSDRSNHRIRKLVHRVGGPG